MKTTFTNMTYSVSLKEKFNENLKHNFTILKTFTIWTTQKWTYEWWKHNPNYFDHVTLFIKIQLRMQLLWTGTHCWYIFSYILHESKTKTYILYEKVCKPESSSFEFTSNYFPHLKFEDCIHYCNLKNVKCHHAFKIS